MEKSENLRKLNELAIQCGRKRQNGQTGLLHYFHGQKNEEPPVTIPLYENLLFALALMRSRTSENILEGKEILGRLLFFQAESQNFPIYLHDYPLCKDRWAGVKILLPLYWMLVDFHSVLGQDMKHKIEKSIHGILECSWKSYEERAAPYVLAVKLAAGSAAFGKFTQSENLQKKGEALLESLSQKSESWISPHACGQIFAALQMVYPKLAETDWELFWDFISSTWHQPTGCYIGPMDEVAQHGHEPQVTLHDYYLGLLSGVFPERCLKDLPVNLETVLIQSNAGQLPEEAAYPCSGVSANSKFMKKVEYAYNLGTSIPLTLIWGNQKRVHSFVCQSGNIQSVTTKEMEDGIEFIVTLGGDVNVEDREKNREIMFFLDRHEKMNIQIEHYRATTFQLGEVVKVESGGLKLELSFEIEKGEGHFLGHILPGNRPNQVASGGIHRFDAYDWQIFLRTIRRSESCDIKVKLKTRSAN